MPNIKNNNKQHGQAYGQNNEIVCTVLLNGIETRISGKEWPSSALRPTQTFAVEHFSIKLLKQIGKTPKIPSFNMDNQVTKYFPM